MQHTQTHTTSDDAKPGPSWLCTEVSVAKCSLTIKISAALLQTSLFFVHISEGLAVNQHNKNMVFLCIHVVLPPLLHPDQVTQSNTHRSSSVFITKWSTTRSPIALVDRSHIRPNSWMWYTNTSLFRSLLVKCCICRGMWFEVEIQFLVHYCPRMEVWKISPPLVKGYSMNRL